jgi:hypothetical protein
MPDMYAPVATQIKPPDPAQGINTMSGILGLQQQKQSLQTGQYTQQQEQLKAGQAQGVQDFFSTWDPTQHISDDGSTDLDSALQSKEFKGAGNAKPAIMQALLDVKNKQLGNKQALTTLNSDVVKQFGTGMGALAKDEDVVADKTDPATGVNAGRAKIDQFLGNFGKLSPDAARIAGIYGPVTQHAPAGKLSHGVAAMQLQAQSASEQQSQQNPVSGSFDTNANIIPTVTNKAIGIPQPTGQQIPKQFAPQVINSPTTGGAYRLTPTGTAAPITAAPGQGQTPFQNPAYQGQQSDVAANQTEVRGVRTAGDQAPLAANINQQILRLSKDSKTGPGTDTWQHVVGAVGAPFGLSPTASYQEVGKFLEKNAIANMQSMGGPPSDSRLDAAAKANGSTSFSPEALQKVTKFNDATTTALAQYRQGIDHSIGMGQNVDYTKLPAFKAAWAKNFDVDVFRVENALRDKDSAELATIKHELGPERLKALAQKRQNLTALAQGQLPQ